MKKFWGDINGKLYTDKDEFDKALAALDSTDDICVSYKYVTVMDVAKKITAEDNKNAIECDKNYVSENQYVKKIACKKDVELDADLIDKIKNADNRYDIKDNVCKKISYFDSKIEDNLLHINELTSDYKKLDEKIKLINNQIKTLDDANNNYYLHKEYYTNINNLIDDVDISIEEECSCDSDSNECNCGTEYKKNKETLSLKDICDMSPGELVKYFDERKVHTFGDLVEYFLNNY